MKLTMKLRNETKSCYRFEARNKRDDSLMTLYLKKVDVDEAKINPEKGIVITIAEKE